MNLLAVQQRAIRAAAGRRGFAYFMEQGLGKTLTALAEFLELVAMGAVTKLVVICPNSFKSGWVEDAEKHGINIDPYIWQSGAEYECITWMKKLSNVPKCLILNYEAIRSEAVQRMVERFVAGTQGMIVFDESIQLKTHDSKQTKAAIALSKHFLYRRILSGKPITQGPHDLWAQMRAIGQLEGRNYFAFKTAFCKMGGFKMKQVVGAQNEDILAEYIEPHVFRATKADWTDLPPKLYTTREYSMTAEMRTMYKSMEEEFVLWLGDEENVAVDAAITKYIKLAQIQAGFIIDENGKVVELVEDNRNPRLSLLLDVLDNEVNGKCTIVYNHKHVYNILMRALASSNPAYIKGEMTPDEVSEQKRRFNDDPACRVILLQTRAAKYGHTLLGGDDPKDRCSTSIVYENTYSLDDRSQIEDRIHRHGQTAESVLYIDLVGTSLDRNAVRALQRKEDVFQAVFKGIKSRSRTSPLASSS